MCDVNVVSKVVRGRISDAQLESNIGAELQYLLPLESKAQFNELFEFIDSQKSELKVASYGVSVTTMEEVFLR